MHERIHERIKEVLLLLLSLIMEGPEFWRRENPSISTYNSSLFLTEIRNFVEDIRKEGIEGNEMGVFFLFFLILFVTAFRVGMSS